MTFFKKPAERQMQWTSWEQSHRYHVTDLSTQKMAFTNRMPRKDSKFWGTGFMIWDAKENIQVSI